MLQSLADVDPVRGAGLLARMWLRFADGHPWSDGEPISDDQKALEERVLGELRGRLGISAQDASADAVRRLMAALSEEADAFDRDIDEDAALDRQGDAGELPSDLYVVEIDRDAAERPIQPIALTRALIEAVVRWPDAERHHREPPASEFIVWLPRDTGVQTMALYVRGLRRGRRLSVTRAMAQPLRPEAEADGTATEPGRPHPVTAPGAE
jgi:hypothetical protein